MRNSMKMFRYVVVLTDGTKRGFEFSREMNDKTMIDAMNKKGLEISGYYLLNTYYWNM